MQPAWRACTLTPRLLFFLKARRCNPSECALLLFFFFFFSRDVVVPLLKSFFVVSSRWCLSPSPCHAFHCGCSGTAMVSSVLYSAVPHTHKMICKPARKVACEYLSKIESWWRFAFCCCVFYAIVSSQISMTYWQASSVRQLLSLFSVHVCHVHILMSCAGEAAVLKLISCRDRESCFNSLRLLIRKESVLCTDNGFCSTDIVWRKQWDPFVRVSAYLVCSQTIAWCFYSAYWVWVMQWCLVWLIDRTYPD